MHEIMDLVWPLALMAGAICGFAGFCCHANKDSEMSGKFYLAAVVLLIAGAIGMRVMHFQS